MDRFDSAWIGTTAEQQRFLVQGLPTRVTLLQVFLFPFALVFSVVKFFFSLSLFLSSIFPDYF